MREGIKVGKREEKRGRERERGERIERDKGKIVRKRGEVSE